MVFGPENCTIDIQNLKKYTFMYIYTYINQFISDTVLRKGSKQYTIL